jgi:5-methylcytosine-specific restriction endonuclease McrA
MTIPYKEKQKILEKVEHAFKVAIRKETFFEENKRCKYCRCLLTLKTVTADHKKPQAKGGRTIRENITPSCQPCNRLKGSMSEAKFMSLIKKPPEYDTSLDYMKTWIKRKIMLQTIRTCEQIEKMTA